MKAFKQAYDDAWRDFLLFLKANKTAIYTVLVLTLPLMLLTHVVAPMLILPVTFIAPISLGIIFTVQLLGHVFSSPSTSKPDKTRENYKASHADLDKKFRKQTEQHAPKLGIDSPDNNHFIPRTCALKNTQENKSSPQLFRPISPQNQTLAPNQASTFEKTITEQRSQSA